MSEPPFRLKHPTRSDELRAEQGDGAELPLPAKGRRRRTFSETLDDTIRAIRRMPTQEEQALLDLQEVPVDASRVPVNRRRAIVERFQTVDHIDAPNVHSLAPQLAARRYQREIERTWFDELVLDRLRERPEWLDYALACMMIGFSLVVLLFALKRYVP